MNRSSRVTAIQRQSANASTKRRRILLILTLIVILAIGVNLYQAPSKRATSTRKILRNPQSVVAKSPLSSASTTTTIDPGLLSQTNTRPTSNSSALRVSMENLFNGISQDSISLALSSFFTLDSYLSVKSLKDDAYDYAARLVFEFTLDVEAAHSYIASQGSATYTGFYIPKNSVHYVPPGECYNRLGYWMVPDARILYSVNGKTYSIGIASLISWRGTWYVVHLGAINRNNEVGIVDAPASGVGAPGPTGGC